MTIRDNRDYMRVLLYSYYTTITGWGVLLRFRVQLQSSTGSLRVEGLGFPRIIGLGGYDSPTNPK